MRLLPKLTLGILAASAVPLAIAGLSSAHLSESALRTRIEEEHAALAKNQAEGVGRFFGGILSSLEIYPQLADLENTSPQVATGVLRLAYRSDENVVLVALLDAQGTERLPSVYLTDPDEARRLGERDTVTEAERDAFLVRVPVAEALAEGRAIGPVVLAGTPPAPRCAVAVAFPGRLGRYVLAVDVTLRRLDRQLGALSVGGTDVVLVDARRLAVTGVGLQQGQLHEVVLPLDKDPAGPLPSQASVATVRAPGKPPALAAFAPTSTTGFGVVVTQPESTAFANARALRYRTWYFVGVSVLLSLLVAFALARGVSHRVGILADGTAVLARGQFDARLDATGKDELAELARAFNTMAAELGHAADEIRRRNDEISAKNEEITRWNQELEKRVEEKTQELKQAQEMVLRSRSLAAIGTLGAGIAHEINNPLTGVLGSAQLLLMDMPKGCANHELAKEIESQAQRIRNIVSNMLRVAQRETGERLLAINLNQVLDDALDLVGPDELKKARVEVERLYDESLPAMKGNRGKLREALFELLTNAWRAMPEGGRLTLCTASPDSRLVSIRISDTGHGIASEVIDKIFDPFFTTKKNWTSTGMGLTLVHKIVEEHQGTIAVDSQSGKGATFTMTFPSDTTRAHLE